jgi:hypothetical protein
MPAGGEVECAAYAVCRPCRSTSLTAIKWSFGPGASGGKSAKSIARRDGHGQLARVEAVRSHIGRHAAESPFIGKAHSSRVTVCRLSRVWKRCCEQAGLDGNFASHTARKTFGYFAPVDRHVSIEVIQKALNLQHRDHEAYSSNSRESALLRKGTHPPADNW